MNLYKYFLILILTFYTGISFAQTTPVQVVNVKVKAPKSASSNSIAEADVIIQIKKGWHINSNKPLDENLSPTVVSIKDNPNIQVKKIIYPEPLISKLQISQSQMALYEGEAVVKIQFMVNKGLKKQAVKINGEVQYQPCNDQTCLFPAAKNFSIDLKIKK